jgi:hypothetical protein
MSTTSQANRIMIDGQQRKLPVIEDARVLKDGDVQTRPTVIVNADDWGRDIFTTDRTLECLLQGAISSASAMVFMEDSARAADLAGQYGVGTGLHLNLTLPFTARPRLGRLMEYQEQIGRFLSSHRLAPIIYHRRLVKLFDYVVKAQIEEYERLYGKAVDRIDGHHHMHLCRNVLVQGLLPEGIVVRRNLTFRKGEKGFFNRFYRSRQDMALARRHRMADFFFDLQPVESVERLKEICTLGGGFNIEIETHPIRDAEYKFLMNGGLARCVDKIAVARNYILRDRLPEGGAAIGTAQQQEGRPPQ